MTILFKGGVSIPQGSLTVKLFNQAPMWITPSGSLGSNHESATITSQNYSVQATDPDNGPSPLTYTIVGGALPTGATLNSTTGAITGPAVTVGTTTTYNFTVRASDGFDSVDRAFSITVNNNTQPVWQTASGSLGSLHESLTITSQNYSVQATDADGLPMALTYSVVAGALPTGATLNSTTGAITGPVVNVTADTQYIFTIRADDGLDFADRQFSITVLNNTIPVWQTAANMGSVNENSAFSKQVTATDADGLPNPVTYSKVSGATWLSVSSSGLITGTAPSVTVDTLFSITVRASDGLNFVDRTFNVTVLNVGGGGGGQ